MIDLHIHSSLSDGTDSPKEIIDLVKIKGIKTFSITDHDNIEADKIINAQYSDLFNELGLNYINGVEFSTDYKGQSIHILAYDYSLEDSAVIEIVNYIHDLRVKRFDKRIKDIKIYHKIEFTQEELDWLYSRQNPGKPHIAMVLIKKGYAQSIKEAFDKYMPDKLGSFKINAIDIIKKLTSHNIVVGIAHPLGGQGEERISVNRFEQNVQELVEYGVSFLECYYSLYNEKEREIIKMVANKYGLALSGGSDYHGTNKDIKLGDLGDNYIPNKEDLTVLKLLHK